jgi:hypothetical protein
LHDNSVLVVPNGVGSLSISLINFTKKDFAQELDGGDGRRAAAGGGASK